MNEGRIITKYTDLNKHMFFLNVVLIFFFTTVQKEKFEKIFHFMKIVLPNIKSSTNKQFGWI